jgi:hypothetical protein
VIALVAVAWRMRGRTTPSPMLLAAAAGALTFWVLSALVRADNADPTASRYIYVGAVFVLLIVAEAGIGASVHRAWILPIVVLIIAAIVGNVRVLRNGERGLRGDDALVRASLRATEIAAPVVSPAFMPSPVAAPQVTAGPYLAAVRDLGSPALTTAELTRAPEYLRESGDGVLAAAERIMAAPATSLAPLTGCRRLIPGASLGSVQVPAAPGTTLVIRAPQQAVSVYVRRFADGFRASAPLATVPARQTTALAFPRDLAPAIPWHVSLVTSGTLEVCTRITA